MNNYALEQIKVFLRHFKSNERFLRKHLETDEGYYERDEEYTTALSVMNQLSDEMREIVRNVFVCHGSVKGTAKELGVPARELRLRIDRELCQALGITLD